MPLEDKRSFVKNNLNMNESFEGKESFDNLVKSFQAEIEKSTKDFIDEDIKKEQILESIDLDKETITEITKELKIDEKLQGLNMKAEQISDDIGFQLGFSENDFLLIEKKFGIKITTDNIKRYPKNFIKKITNSVKNKINNKLEFDTEEIEALKYFSKNDNETSKIFYEGQEDNIEVAKNKWIDSMAVYKDASGCKYGRLSEYLDKISLLKTNNGYHEYAQLLKKALNGKDFRIDYVKELPSVYGGGKWINMNPYIFTAQEDSNKFTERLFYYYTKLRGNELSFIHSLLHEGTHAVMLNIINNPKNPEQVKARDILYSIYSYVVSKAPEYNAQDFYGLTDLDEFCAEYYTIGSIRKLLEKIKIDNSEDFFYLKNNYPETMSKPEGKRGFEKLKRLFLQRKPSEITYQTKNLTELIEENVKKLIGISFEYELKDESIDGIINNYASKALSRSFSRKNDKHTKQ